MKKRILSTLLTLCMVLTLLPINALADFTLVDGAIQGQVFGAVSGTVEPVGETVNVAVYAQDNLDTALATCTTDVNGVFTLTKDDGFSAGNYTIVLTSSLYLTEKKEISIPSGSIGYTFARIDLAVLGKVYGTVTDATTGATLSGVKVEAYQDSTLIASTTTDASGAYFLEGERGSCQLVFTKGGYNSKTVKTKLSGPIGEELVDIQMISTGGGTGGGGSHGGNSGDEVEVVDSGICGDTLTWTMDANGILTISGTGQMGNYTPDFYPHPVYSPWYGYGYQAKIKNIVIESGVTSIGVAAFYGCSGLTSVSIPNSVTSIGNFAFRGCSNLINMTVPNSVISIGNDAFYDCSSLTNVTIPNSVTHIGDSAFTGCSSLANVTISNSVTHIGDSAFSFCSSLTNITIPKSITEISDGAFGCCSNLTNVTIPDSVTSIGYGAFESCSSLTNVTIPDSVTSIGMYAFSDCTALTSVTIPNSVISIGHGAFECCISLTSVIIPNGISTIMSNTFADCSSLTWVVIPNSVTQIRGNAFGGACNPTDVYYGGTEKEWNTAFSSSYNLDGATIHYNSTGPEGGNTKISLGTVPGSIYTGDNNCVVNSFAINWTAEDAKKTVSWQSSNPEVFQLTGLTSYTYDGNSTSWSISGNALSEGTSIITIITSDGAIASFTIEVKGKSENPNHFYETQNPVTDTKSLLNSYVEDWNAAYTKYVEAVDKALQVFASDSAPNRDEVIQSQKLAMMEADSHAGNKGSRYISGSGFPDDETKDAAYEALSTFLYDHIYSAIDLSNISVEDINGTKLVNTILNGIRSDSETYQIGHVKVAITTSGFGSVSFGMLTCSSRQVVGLYTYGICSSTAKCEQAIRAYMRELIGLENSAIYRVYSAVCKDVLGQSLDKLTQNYLKTKLQPLLPKLPPKVGSLLTDLNSCYNYYQYVKKIMGWAGNADTPENILAAMQGIEFKDESIQDRNVKKAWKALKKASSNLNDAYMCYLSGTLDESKIATWWNNTVDWWSNKVTSLKAFFTCPVNVSVYDSAGQEIGYAGDDDIWYADGLIYIEERGDAKIIYSFTDDLISFQVTATDYGAFGCCIEQYDEGGRPIGRTNYYDIELEPGKNFSVLGSQNEENVSYKITEGNNLIDADEYIPSNQNATISVRCDAETGGAIYGTGTYVRGDAVVLLAEPGDNYHFIGWYQNDDLMYTSRIYEFTAKEDVNLKAVFRPDTNGEIEHSYVIAFNANGGTISGSNALTTSIDGKLSSLPTATRNSYTFDGWYTAASDGEKITTDYIFTSDTTVYAHWTKNSDGSSGDASSGGSFAGGGSYGGGSSKPSIKPGVTSGTQTAPTTPESSSSNVAGFSDVAASAWYADFVQYVVERGLFGGVGNGRFAPDENMTRAMMWTVLARYKGVNTNTGANWYEAARTWAMEQDISDGTMANDNVTREQFVTMLWRLSVEPTVATAASFTDSGSVSDYAKTAVDWAVSKGIVNGYNDGSFKPQGNATRAEVAKMLTVYCVINEG